MHAPQEALRKYSVVPVVTRMLAADDELLGHAIPKGTMVACLLKGTHHMYEEPLAFRPQRFMPGGEYDQFDDSIRAYMFLPFIQVSVGLTWGLRVPGRGQFDAMAHAPRHKVAWGLQQGHAAPGGQARRL